jgi:hypothetical protein
MVKRILMALFALFLFFPVFSLSAQASTNQDLLEVQERVDKANDDIQLKINQGIVEGEALLAKLKKDILESRPIQNLLEEQSIKNKQEALVNDLEEELKTSPLIENSEEQIKLKQRVAEEKKKLVEVTEKILKLQAEEDRKINEAELKFKTESEKIINQLIIETNAIAAGAKGEGEKKGFTVICEWKFVEIAGFGVWIDPLRVVGIK